MLTVHPRTARDGRAIAAVRVLRWFAAPNACRASALQMSAAIAASRRGDQTAVTACSRRAGFPQRRKSSSLGVTDYDNPRRRPQAGACQTKNKTKRKRKHANETFFRFEPEFGVETKSLFVCPQPNEGETKGKRTPNERETNAKRKSKAHSLYIKTRVLETRDWETRTHYAKTASI